ncbi:carbohydrate ABC transporter permease [Hungatella effluvii]|uniref:carbohydrate ABC transporter permease n=1 Tax=Hungatella effluvii TaxID=1096246 RepID=UPI0022E916C7|nr:sugar ABC transporter permease [Hungatella effluvii]
MNRVLSNKKAVFIFLLPALVLFLTIIIVPIFMSVTYSLTEWDGIGKKVFTGFDNYKELFLTNSDGFWRAVKNSLIFAAGSVFVQLPISLILALILARGVKGERFYVSVYFIPVLISTVVIGQLWMKIYNPQYGLLNTVLRSMGLEQLTGNWLGDTKKVIFAVIVPVLWQYIGYHMLLMYASVRSISEEIFEAARIDGANGIQTALHITIPLMKPILKVCVTFAVVGSLKNFDLVYVMTGGGPAGASQLPSTLMVETIFSRNMYGYGSSMAIFIILECFLFAWLIRKAFRDNE